MQPFGPVTVSTTAPVTFSIAGSGLALNRHLDVNNELAVPVKVTIGIAVYNAPPSSTTRFPLYGTELSFSVTAVSVPAIPATVSAMAYSQQDLEPENTVRRGGF